MSLPYSLVTGLLEAWPFDELAGSVAHGHLGALDLDLTGSPVSANGWWATSGSGHRYTASATIPVDWALLANVGDECTIACEAWFGGTTNESELGEGADPYSGTCDFMALDPASRFFVQHDLHSPPPHDASENIHVYYGYGVAAGNGVDVYRNAPPFTSTDPYVLIAELVKTDSDTVRCRLYIGNTRVLGDGTADVWTAPASLIRIGKDPNRTMMVRAAVWDRVLTSDEKAALTTLAGLTDLVDGGDPGSGVDTDGDSFWVFDFPAVSVRPIVVGATTDGPRHTRKMADLGGRSASVNAA